MSIIHGIDRMDKTNSQDESQPGKGGVGWGGARQHAHLRMVPGESPVRTQGKPVPKPGGGDTHELFTYGIYGETTVDHRKMHG